MKNAILTNGSYRIYTPLPAAPPKYFFGLFLQIWGEGRWGLELCFIDFRDISYKLPIQHYIIDILAIWSPIFTDTQVTNHRSNSLIFIIAYSKLFLGRYLDKTLGAYPNFLPNTS